MTEPDRVRQASSELGRRVRAELDQLEQTAESSDGLIAATVGARGELRALWLDPRIYRGRDAGALADAIRETVLAAASAARGRAFDIAAPVLPRTATADTTDITFDPVLARLAAAG